MMSNSTKAGFVALALLVGLSGPSEGRKSSLLHWSGARQTSTGPRLGSYKLLTYGAGSVPLYLGYFELGPGGAYSYFNAAKKPFGTGRYAFNAATKTVEWASGPFKDNKWGGGFEVSREGKTHLLRLTRNTIGTNSTDSK